MNKKFVAMSALSLMLSIMFLQAASAADVQAASASAAVSSEAATSTLGGKGGENPQMLGEVEVTGKHEATDYNQESQAETEGSGSYTSNAVTVAGKTPLKRKEIPHSMSVITRQQMDDQNLVTISDVLRQAPGITVVANNSDQDQFRARGAAPNVMYDGVPSYNSLGGYQQFDMALYDRIEVLNGPMGLLQGSDSISGSVNMVKKKARKEFAAHEVVSYGSWNNKRLELDVTGPLNQDKSLRGRMVGAGQDRDYFFDHAHDGRWLGYGVLEYDITSATTATISYTAQEDSNPGFSGLGNFTTGPFLDVPRSTNPYPSWQRYYWNTKETGAGLEHRLDGGWVVKFKSAHKNQTFHFMDSYPTVGVTPGTYNIATYNRRDAIWTYTRDTMDLNASGSFDLLERTHQALVGYNYEKFFTRSMSRTAQTYSNVNLFNPDAIPQLTTPFNVGTESVTKQQGVYGNVRFKLYDPLTLVMGGRLSEFDYQSHNIPPGTPTAWAQGAHVSNKFSPYGGLIYDVNKAINVYGSYSDIFIPQTQLMAAGGTLPPRVGKQYEIGTKGEFFEGGLNASVSVFKINDVNRPYADPANTVFYLPLGNVESKGLDVAVSGSPLSGLELNGGYTWQSIRYLVDKTNTGLPTSNWDPKNVYKMWGNYRVANGVLSGFNFGLGMNGQSRTKGNGTASVRQQGGFTVYTAQVGYRFSKNISTTFTVENLFDKWYYTRIQGNNTYNYYGTPRNYMLTLRHDM